jgi:hypothetical protein
MLRGIAREAVSKVSERIEQALKIFMVLTVVLKKDTVHFKKRYASLSKKMRIILRKNA